MRISRRTLIAAVSSAAALGVLIGGFFVLTGGTAGRPAPGQSSSASGTADLAVHRRAGHVRCAAS